MLPWLKIERWFIAPAANLDIVIFVFAVGYVICWQIGDIGQLVSQFRIKFFSLCSNVKLIIEIRKKLISKSKFYIFKL